MSQSTTRRVLLAMLVSALASCAGDSDSASGVRSFVEASVGDIEAGYTVRGTVRASVESPVVARRSGIVTDVAIEEGEIVRDGTIVVRIDAAPVFAVETEEVFWRDLRSGDEGVDVVALQDFLERQGHAPGPDRGRFDTTTQDAVRRWQEASGQPVTGEVLLGSVIASRPGASASQLIEPGSTVAVGEVLLVLRGPGQSLVIDLSGAQVEGLPDVEGYALTAGADTLTGSLDDVEVFERVADGGEVVHEVVVPLRAQADLPSGLDAPVRVVEERREDVLTVPVDAVYADGGGNPVLWLEAADGELVRTAVDLGLSDGHRVEIVGGSLRAGARIALVP